MNIHDNDDPRDERDDAMAPRPTAPRSTSRDLDAIARRLAAARATAPRHDHVQEDSGDADPDRTPVGHSGVIEPEAVSSSGSAGRTRDAARIRSLIDRTPGGEHVPDARGYASALPVDGSALQAAPSASTDPLQFPRQDETDDLARPLPERPRRLARGIALGITVAVGLVIALGAYAGGGELISSLIDRDSQPRAPRPSAYEIPPVIVDSILSAADSAAQAEQLATFGELANDTIRRAPFGSGRRAALAPVTRPKIGDTLRPNLAATRTVRAGASAPAKAASPVPPAASTASKPSPTPPAPPAARGESARGTSRPGSATQPPKTAGSFRVQVRATPDRSEADRLASRLRSRGARNVTVTTSTKEGKTLYRVRYGAFASADDARGAARRDGHADAWVVPQ